MGILFPEVVSVRNLDLKEESEKSLKRLIPRLKQQFLMYGEKGGLTWESFLPRLKMHFNRLFTIFFKLYRHHYDFFYHLENVLSITAKAALERSEELVFLDRRREEKPLWFHSHKQVGGVCYVDLFAENLRGLKRKIPYFKELGLTYLHLMPLFRAPVKNNDGGYAVSSYREINPDLGSFKDFQDLACELRKNGISLVIDFVFNHTSNEHEWAVKAYNGDKECQGYYWMFETKAEASAYQAYLRDIFPEERRGSFIFKPRINKWIWTTFHNYQWDLNYSNPALFAIMLEEMLFLANAGVEILRLDAVAFIWKQRGSNCENLPQAHLLIQAFNALVSMAAPAMLFKSEAIVHPDEVVKYIHPVECQLSYNPLLMALLWNSLATREVNLLEYSMQHRFKIHPHCLWVNYIRCHDDIGWTFDDRDAYWLGIKALDHRQFLNAFYTGRFSGSFAKGLPFQENPQTGDLRITGTLASLAGLEKAMAENNTVEIEYSIRRILLLHAIILSIGGIPLIYLGDELGQVNDYSFMEQTGKEKDNRWVHRPCINWKEKYIHLKKYDSPQARIFNGLKSLILLRKQTSSLASDEMQVVRLNNPHIFAYKRRSGTGELLAVNNFSEHRQVISSGMVKQFFDRHDLLDLISEEHISSGEDVILEPYHFMWLRAV
ncbi:amylosucrase [Candidatus Riflebacteria bacterium]